MPVTIVECVPNFSEGRDGAKIKAITDALEAVPGVKLLHVDPGADAHRTVVTFIGSPEAVAEAAFQAIAKAAEVIDMREHRGEHPRLGATDVCPFVPVEGATLEDCAEIARKVGRRVGDQLGIPVYFYEAAATDPRRKNLADVRRGEYEGLAEKLSDGYWQPDCGPAILNPRSGATIIGAREFLIAYNVNLNTRDKSAAADIAFDLRERGRVARRKTTSPRCGDQPTGGTAGLFSTACSDSGLSSRSTNTAGQASRATQRVDPARSGHYYSDGEPLVYGENHYPCGNCEFIGETLDVTEQHCRTAHGYELRELAAHTIPSYPKVIGQNVRRAGEFKFCKAIGWYVEEYARAQISMNLTNYHVTPPHLVFERAKQLAADRGLAVTGSELVGMIPYAALLEAGKFYLGRQGRSPEIPLAEILETAVDAMGLRDVRPFDIQEKVIGLPAGVT